jgi:A/G-specific adenine glycosylase
MILKMDLPFGQTQISSSEYAELVDTSEIVNHLEAVGVTKPEARITDLIKKIPVFLEWLDQHGRDYPWRYTTDPWQIYATEILLQRTRANAVADIYESFFGEFPDPIAVVKSDRQAVFEHVRSLGFGEQRTRSIREAARLCVEQNDGDVPDNLEMLQDPWRVGPYSARACLLFAFHRPLALVDSNIARIIERVFDCEMPTQPHKSDDVYTLMDSLIPDQPSFARSINFAFLDLGALICTAQDPQCPKCPLGTCCVYAQSGPDI